MIVSSAPIRESDSSPDTRWPPRCAGNSTNLKVSGLDGEDPSKSSVQLTIQAKSIQTRNKQRDKQLRAKFLDTDNHQTITLKSIKVQQTDENSFTVVGHLTMRGVA